MEAFIRLGVLAIVVSGLSAGFGPLAHATDNQDQTLPQPSNIPPTSSDVDDILTNANLRAASGSKSTWSLSNSITYDGGTVRNPFGVSRPNIANASGTTDVTDINDTLSLKYSINAVDSLLLGGGVRKVTPFSFSGPPKEFYAEGGKDLDFFDPSLTYQHVYKFFGIQAVATGGITQFTREDIHSAKGQNLNQNLSVDQENMYEVGNWSIGTSIGAGFSTPTDASVEFSQWQAWLDPYVEYKFNDTWGLRTVANWFSFEWYRYSGFTQDTYTQSFGVGISLTRDIYLYPNIQFTPEHLSWDITNVGLTATINLF